MAACHKPMNLSKTKYWCIRDDQRDLNLDDNTTVEFCKEYKYLRITFEKTRTNNKELRTRIVQARKLMRCVNGVLWNKYIAKKRTFNINRTHIKSNLLYASDTWRLTKKRVETTKILDLRHSASVSRFWYKSRDLREWDDSLLLIYLRWVLHHPIPLFHCEDDTDNYIQIHTKCAT